MAILKEKILPLYILEKKQKKEGIDEYFRILFKDKELQEELNDALGMEILSNKTKSILEEMCYYEMKILDFGSSQ